MTNSQEEKLFKTVQQGSVPEHVAIIMDGNGRWAAKRHFPRLKGHMAGAEAIRRTITAAREIGIRYLTIYAFSAENWKRPKSEISGLFRLLTRFLKKETRMMLKNDIRLMTIGDISRLPEASKKTLGEAKEKTAHCRSLTVVVALNYGSRQEIASAFAQMLQDFKNKKITDIQPEDIEKYLYTADIPEPELMIRTSGEQRLSNFLLWQLSYAELYFTDVLWPDFQKVDLCRAIIEFQKRKRRFGGL